MDAFFRGRFEIKLDQKARASLPTSFRNCLKTLKKADSYEPLVITNSQFRDQRCLDAYSFSSWKKLEQKISRLPQLNADVQAFQRFYLSGGQPVELDSSNRFLIPPVLRKYAQLETDVVLVGMGEKFEIWSAPLWNGLHENLAKSFDNILAQVAKLEEQK